MQRKRADEHDGPLSLALEGGRETRRSPGSLLMIVDRLMVLSTRFVGMIRYASFLFLCSRRSLLRALFLDHLTSSLQRIGTKIIPLENYRDNRFSMQQEREKHERYREDDRRSSALWNSCRRASLDTFQSVILRHKKVERIKNIRQL